ncbi:MAG: ribosomal-processing cysteine protease Prp [Anaerococcus sp.]|nr:ribosomal-processing cysteine protease Prp [Anaerococcus sp.]
MINVDLLIKEERIVGYEIRGHADFAEPGSDIVCSAVTILAYTCVNTLDKYNTKVEFFDDGDNLLSLKTLEESENIDTVFAYFETGIQTLLANYSDYVKLNYKET